MSPPRLGILNFRGVNKKIEGRVGYQGATDGDVILPYTAKKPGGSDVGHMVAMDNNQYIIKTGVTLSLLSQALKYFLEGSPEEERQCLGFIVGNFTRITGDKAEHHPELAAKLKDKQGDISQKKFADVLVDEMLSTLNKFKETDTGKAILEKLKNTALNTKDIYNIYHYLVTQNDVLRDVIGLPAFSDLVNSAFGQFFNNAYQERTIPREMLDDARLLLEQNDNPAMYLASRFNAQAEPFDKFLLQPFLTNKREDFESKEDWLEKCKQDLAAKIQNLRGMASAILIRHIMGESADMGPDNMLIALYNGTQHIINIDVTGFRYPRREIFQDKQKNQARLGWENTLKSDTPDEIMKFLFDSTVFSDRFVREADSISKDTKPDVMKAIVDVLKSKISLSDAYSEVLDVRAWLQAQSLDPCAASLKAAMEEAYGALNPIVKPQPRYLDKLVKHNIGFIHDSIQAAQKLQVKTAPDASQPGK